MHFAFQTDTHVFQVQFSQTPFASQTILYLNRPKFIGNKAITFAYKIHWITPTSSFKMFNEQWLHCLASSSPATLQHTFSFKQFRWQSGVGFFFNTFLCWLLSFKPQHATYCWKHDGCLLIQLPILHKSLSKLVPWRGHFSFLNAHRFSPRLKCQEVRSSLLSPQSL